MKGRKFLLILFLFILVVFPFMKSAYCYDTIEINDEGKVEVDGVIDEKALMGKAFESPLNNITPNYQIISIVDKRTINAGESITISFQISGNGKVVSNKFASYFPEKLLKDEPVYYMYFAEFVTENETFAVFLGECPDIQTASGKVGAYISLVDTIFMQTSSDSNMIFGELVNPDGEKPIKIKFNSSEIAPPGDYVIRINFVYSDGVSWYSSQDEITIHIRDWYEKIEWQIFLILFTGILLALFDYYLKRRKFKTNNISDTEINQQTPKKNTKKRKNNNKTH